VTRAGAALLLAGASIAAGAAAAATAYVTDELVLGVYPEQSTQGTRLATLHSGASVETLAVSGEATEVRLPDGKVGWVKTSYLTTREPAVVRVKQLQDELDRSRATTPELAEAAARSEVARLTRELAARQDAVRQDAVGKDAVGQDAVGQDAARPAAASGSAGGPASNPDGAAAVSAPRATQPPGVQLWLWMGSVCAALGCGFWLGYAALARRVREKFGGIKVY
jgi:hypothetical protein